jgi:AraC family transcriptional activator of pobA
MDEILKFDTVSQYNAFNNHETLHPLVSVIDFSKAAPRRLRRMYFGFYLVLLKDVQCGDLRYGKNTYDYQEGTLIFLAPGQVMGADAGEELYQPKGYGIVFHPDLIKGTSLGRHIDDYTFFSYNVNEALHHIRGFSKGLKIYLLISLHRTNLRQSGCHQLHIAPLNLIYPQIILAT